MEPEQHTQNKIFDSYLGHFPQNIIPHNCPTVSLSKTALDRVPFPDGLSLIKRPKCWHYFSLTHPQFFMSVALVNVGYLTQYFVAFFDRTSHKIYHWGQKFLGPSKVEFSESSTRGYSSCLHSKKGRVQIQNTRRHFFVNLEQKTKKNPFLSLSLQTQRCDESLNLIYPLSTHQRAYVHKEFGLLLGGELVFGGKRWSLGEETIFSSDWTKSQALRKTYWNWANMCWKSSEGELLGINLSRFVYDHEGLSCESFVSSKEGITLFPYVSFQFDHQKGSVSLKASQKEKMDKENSLNLSFCHQFKKKERVNLGFIKSAYDLYGGAFSGVLYLKGREYRLEKVFGVVEEHEALW